MKHNSELPSCGYVAIMIIAFSPPVLPSGVVDRLEEDEETLLANVSSICTEKALFGKFCDWVLDPNVDNLMELSCLPSDRCPYPKVTWGVALPGATSEEGKVLFR